MNLSGKSHSAHTSTEDNAASCNFLMEGLLAMLLAFRELGLLAEASPHIHTLMTIANRSASGTPPGITRDRAKT